MEVERLGCSISRKEVQCLLQDRERSIIIHLIQSRSRLHLLYWLIRNDIGWSLVATLNQRSDSRISPVFLQRTKIISRSYRGLTTIPTLFLVSIVVLVSCPGKHRIVPPVKICFQCVELRISLVKASAHALCQIPNTFPFCCHVLHQQPQHVFNYPITTAKYSFGGFFGL